METCFLPSSRYILVPQTIPAGYQVTKGKTRRCLKGDTLSTVYSWFHYVCPRPRPLTPVLLSVDAVNCGSSSVQLYVTDPSFTIGSNGVIVALSPVDVSPSGRTFSVWARDSEMKVHLVHGAPPPAKVKSSTSALLSFKHEMLGTCPHLCLTVCVHSRQTRAS